MSKMRDLVPVIVLVSIGVCAWAASPAERSLTIDPAGSHVLIHVGKSGVLGFAGHDHEVAAQEVSGRVELDTSDWQRSRVSLQFASAGLRVTGKGDPPGDVPEVQRVMASDRVLDAKRFPTIAFQSRRVAIGRQAGSTVDLVIDGDLTLHGVTRPLTVKASTSIDASGGLTARGAFSIKQSDFGIEPVTAGGGTVRVKDPVDVDFVLLAR